MSNGEASLSNSRKIQYIQRKNRGTAVNKKQKQVP